MRNSRLGSLLISFSLLIVALTAQPVFGGQHLLLIGGGESPPVALGRFVETAGSRNASILVITWATDFPDDVFSDISRDLTAFSPSSIVHAQWRPHNAAEISKFLAQLENATAVFFSGGDQNSIFRTLLTGSIRQRLLERYDSGVPFAGTSAGTAVMSEGMLTGHGAEVMPGLGALPGTILDTHFLVRQRLRRLSEAVSAFPQFMGIGIDEDGAIWIEDGSRVECLSPKPTVTVRVDLLSGRNDTRMLMPGTRFTLPLQSPN